MDVEDRCCLYQERLGHLPYALSYCPTIQEHWNRHISFLIEIDKEKHRLDIELRVKEKGCMEDMANFFLIAWDIWFRRNKMVNDKISVELRQVIEHALSMQKIHKELKTLPSTKTNTYYYIRLILKLFQVYYLKLNVDGAILF